MLDDTRMLRPVDGRGESRPSLPMATVIVPALAALASQATGSPDIVLNGQALNDSQRLAFANLPALISQRHSGGHAEATDRTWVGSDGRCVVVAGKSSSGIGSFGASTC